MIAFDKPTTLCAFPAQYRRLQGARGVKRGLDETVGGFEFREELGQQWGESVQPPRRVVDIARIGLRSYLSFPQRFPVVIEPKHGLLPHQGLHLRRRKLWTHVWLERTVRAPLRPCASNAAPMRPASSPVCAARAGTSTGMSRRC